jgi:RND family efflux transporter MFP subunit
MRLVVILTAAGVVSGGCVRSAPAAPIVTVVTERQFVPRVVATGSVRLVAGARVDVGARASGVVRRVAVAQGTRVRRGDTIAELDDREARARLASAEARVAELEATLDAADSDLARLNALRAIRGASGQQLQTAASAIAIARARLAAAIGDRDLAALSLGYTVVRAPIDGIVASIATHQGETVAASLAAPTFVVLIDSSRLECVALVDETDIGRVRVGDSASFTVDAYADHEFTGHVTRIAPDATIIGGVVDYEVTIHIDDPAGLLLPQMTSTVTIAGPPRRSLAVPPSAVRQSANGTYAWRVRGGRPKAIPVLIASRDTQVAEVTSGLSVGDTVLTANFPTEQNP